MATWQDLIDKTLLMIGAVGSGETPATQERSDAFIALGQIFMSWSNEGLVNPTKVFESFSLVDGDATYTMGSGGNFSATRPMQILSARVVTGNFNQGLEVMSYAAASQRAQNLAGAKVSLPSILGYDNGNPLVNILIHPPPLGTPMLELVSMKPLTALGAIGDTYTLLPGWDIALKYALGLHLAPEYGSPFLNEANAALAQQYKAAIIQPNLPPALPGGEVAA